MILLIDDAPKHMKEYLEELEDAGINFKFTHDPQNGIEIFKKYKSSIGLVVLDMIMPPPPILGNIQTSFGNRTGEFVAKRIKEIDKNVPIMILTNKSLSSIDLKGYKNIILCSKTETLPETFVEFLTQYLRHSGESKETLNENSNDIIVLEPNFYGIGINFNELIKRIKRIFNKSKP